MHLRHSFRSSTELIGSVTFSGVLLSAVSAAAAAGEEGLVACYRFDGGQGTTLHDRSGHGNHGNIHGASWVPSGSGFALRFDGLDDYVDCGSRPSLNVFKAVSLEVNIYDRAISAEEVDRHYHTTRLTGEITIRPYLYASSGTLVVDADLRALGELPVGALLRVEFFAPGSPTPLAASRVLPSPSSDAVEVCLTLGELAPGEYELRASVVDRQGKAVGKTAKSRVK